MKIKKAIKIIAILLLLFVFCIRIFPFIKYDIFTSGYDEVTQTEYLSYKTNKYNRFYGVENRFVNFYKESTPIGCFYSTFFLETLLEALFLDIKIYSITGDDSTNIILRDDDVYYIKEGVLIPKQNEIDTLVIIEGENYFYDNTSDSYYDETRETFLNFKNSQNKDIIYELLNKCNEIVQSSNKLPQYPIEASRKLNFAGLYDGISLYEWIGYLMMDNKENYYFADGTGYYSITKEDAEYFLNLSSRL